MFIFGTSFFFGKFVQKLSLSCFLDSFVQKTTQQSDSRCNARSDSQLLRKVFKNSLFKSAITYEKYTVSKEYCISHHDAKIYLLPICRCHILLLGNVEELLQILDPLCFTYQHMDRLYALLKYRFNGNIIVRIGQVIDNVRRAVYFNQRNRRMDRMPSVAKKRLLRKKYKRH